MQATGYTFESLAALKYVWELCLNLNPNELVFSKTLFKNYSKLIFD